MKNLIGLLLLLPCQLLAQNSFEELFDLDTGRLQPLADQVSLYYSKDLDSNFDDQQQQLLSINKQLDQLLQQQANNPLLWFLQGLNYNNLASLHFSSDPSTSKKYTVKKLDAYEQAMDLDKTQRPHLTAAMYATMKLGLAMDKKIIAIQKELALGGNGENESYYWYLHWSNIHNLTQAGRLEEAQQAAQQMRRELQANDQTKQNYQQILKQVKDEVTEAQKQKQKTQPKNQAKPTTSKTDQPESGEPESRKMDKRAEVLSMSNILWYLLISVILLLIIGLIYEYRIRKK